jgi:hypothetical protein
VRLIVNRTQPRDGDVRVELCRGQCRVAEQFLDDPKISATLQQMRRSAVTKAVRADVWGTVDRCHGLVHDGARLPRV